MAPRTDWARQEDAFELLPGLADPSSASNGMTSTMCQLPTASQSSPPSAGAKCAFSCKRHNSTTFVLQEDDKWGEQPLIYAKLLARHLVLIDSGCGGSRHSPGRDTTLRRFLETVPVSDNGNRPLNASGQKAYSIICTHCHYDHVGGIDEFISAPRLAVWASRRGESFMTDPSQFATASLCRYVGMPPPEFTVTDWADEGARIAGLEGSGATEDLGLVLYQTPGHMPDQVAVWDPEERFLYVGDTIYEHAPILFPERSSFREYGETIQKLQRLVEDWNSSSKVDLGRVKLSSGHNTRAADAAELIDKVASFHARVMASEVLPVNLTGDLPWFGGKPAVEPTDAEGGMQFMGLRTSFEQLS